MIQVGMRTTARRVKKTECLCPASLVLVLGPPSNSLVKCSSVRTFLSRKYSTCDILKTQLPFSVSLPIIYKECGFLSSELLDARSPIQSMFSSAPKSDYYVLNDDEIATLRR